MMRRRFEPISQIFLKNIYTAQSLAPTGSRKVECFVKSTSTITHSYTILPTIYANSRRLYIVMQEPSSHFSHQGHFISPNLLVDCHTSHIMTKPLMFKWLSRFK